MKNNQSIATSETIPLGFNICDERGKDAEVVAEVVTRDYYRLAELKKAGFRPSTIVDIGAHIGTFAVMANFYWPEAEIYCFEPDERSFELLCQNAPFAKCYNKAVYNKEDSVSDAFENEAAGRTGATQEPAEQHTSVARSSDSSLAVDESRQQISFEQVLAENHLSSIDLLKLNCEGSEFNILRDTPADCLAKVRHVVGKYHHATGPEHFMEVACRALPHLRLECGSGSPSGPFFSKIYQRKLEIGFRLQPRPGYEPLEIDPDSGDESQPPMDAIPCDDETFDELRATRVLERVEISAGQRALKEWYRILKPGGFCQVETSNLESH